MPSARFQPSFAGGVIGPGLHGRIDLARYDIGLKVGTNVFVHVHGGVSNRAGTEFIAEVWDHADTYRLLPFQRDDDDNYVMVMGDGAMQIIYDGAWVETAPSTPYQPTTPFADTDLATLDYAQSVDVMFFAHQSYPPQKMSRTAATSWTFEGLSVDPVIDTAAWLDLSSEPGDLATGLKVTPYDAGLGSFADPTNFANYEYVLTVEYAGGETLPTPPVRARNFYDLTFNATVRNVLTWDAMASAVQYHVYRRVGSAFKRIKTITAGTETYTDQGTDTPTSDEPPAAGTGSAGSAGSETYTYVLSPVVAGVEGFPSSAIEVTSAQDLSVAGAKNTLTWAGTADEYNVYRERNGIFGFIGFTADTTFVDDNIAPNLSITPREPTGLFAAAGDYPATVAIHQQRLMLGASTNQPETIWGSLVGDYENFTKSRILQSSDRVEISLSGEQINQVRSMLSLRELLVFSSASEFTLSGPDGSFPADNVISTVYGRSGSIKVKPLVIDDTALFVDRTGRQVRDLRYSFEQDGYAGNDLTVFASHFFTGRTIKEWAFCQSPFSIVWVALDDGTLLSLTYKREHQIWAWTEHDIGGAVESLTAIREGGEDALYLLVRRTIDGSTVRYVERLHSREMSGAAANAFFVDCGITYSGTATATITGLDHLEGEDVVALADGAVVEGLTVASGSVTLPYTAELVHVGLPFTAEIETLPPAIDLQDVGAARGRPHFTNKVRVQLQDTRGIEVADAGRSFTDVIQTGTDLAVPPALFTGMIEQTMRGTWNRDGTIVIRQTNPLPMTILGISPELTIGRSG